MPGIIPNDAELAILEDMLDNHTLTLRLFANDIVPDETTTAGSFTEYPLNNGYMPKVLPSEDWSFSAGSPTYTTFSQQAFVFEFAAGFIFGYYLTDETGRLRGCERFIEPFATNAGVAVKVTPKFSVA